MVAIQQSVEKNRRKKGRMSATLLSIVLMSLTACQPAPDNVETRRIAVTILPQKDIVQRIAGKRFHVDVLVPPGFNPATYAPAPRQIRRMGSSLVWFRIGRLPVELAWMDRIRSINPHLNVVDTAEGVDWLVPNGRDTHEVAGVDPHIWLSPRLMRIQARHVRNALVRLDAGQSETYRRNYRQLATEIAATDKQIREILADLSCRDFLAFHPSWTYFAREYGLNQIAIEVDGKSPAPGDLSHVIAMARRKGLHTVFVQPQFDTAAAEVVAQAIDGRVVVLDPLAANWAENLISTARKLRAAQEVSLQ